jgi:hypothetical protein
MGSLGNVVEFLRSVVAGAQAPTVKVDRGGNDSVGGGHFSAPGDDSPPLSGDLAYLGSDQGAGAVQMLGYQDPLTAPKAAAGEKRIYARSGPGVVACEVWLKADGTVLVSNGLGGIELAPDGSVTFTTSLGTFGADSHSHPSPFGPLGAPIPGT